MTTTVDQDLQFEPLSAALGAVVHGADLGNLSDRQVTAIRASWLEHKVLFFRGQVITPDDHLAFARRLGEVEVHPYVESLPERPAIQIINSDRGGRADIWHSDATFEERPPAATILRYVSGPDRGGDTMWSDQCLAYEQCSDALRSLLDGLTAMHTAATFGKPEARAEHPVVRIHPETGRRALYVNRQFTAFVPQLHRVESDSLLAHLYDWCTRPEVSCRWSWQQGDVVLWDNRATQHYAVNDYEQPRILERVILAGDRPAGGSAGWADHPAQRLSASSAARLAVRR